MRSPTIDDSESGDGLCRCVVTSSGARPPSEKKSQIYIMCRLSILAAVVNLFVGGAAANHGALNCTAWVKAMFVSGIPCPSRCQVLTSNAALLLSGRLYGEPFDRAKSLRYLESPLGARCIHRRKLPVTTRSPDQEYVKSPHRLYPCMLTTVQALSWPRVPEIIIVDSALWQMAQRVVFQFWLQCWESISLYSPSYSSVSFVDKRAATSD